MPIARPALAPLDMPPPLDGESDTAVEAELGELEVASTKEDVDEVDREEEEDVVEGEWTTAFSFAVEEVIEDAVEEVEELVGEEEEEVKEVDVVLESVSVSSTLAGVGNGVGVGVGVGVVLVVGETTAALLRLFSLLFDLLLSGEAAAVMYPPTGPSNVFGAT